MNELMNVNQSQELTMSSREIAELLGKQHSNIKISAERLATGGTIALQGSKFEHCGNTYTEYLLNKRDSLILVAQNSPEFTAVIVDRWQELESQQPKLPQSKREWIEFALEQEKQLEVSRQQLAIAAPKAEFADAIAGDDKGVKLGQFAKSIGIGPRKIFTILRELRILMTGYDRHNLPYQEYIERGYFSVKQGTYETNSETRISHTSLITGKGEIWLRKKLLDAGYLKAIAA